MLQSRTRGSALRRLPALGLLALVLSFFTMSFLSVPAQAADCVPSSTNGCVQGLIKTATDEPAEGVSLSLKGSGVDQETTTDASGRWVFSVSKAGEYTVTVDPDSLPAGHFFKSKDAREVNVALFESVSALFPLTDNEAEAVEPGSLNEPAPSETPAATPDDSVAPPTEADSVSSSFSWPRFWQQAASGLRIGLLLALGAVGLSLVFGTTGLANFAHAETLTLGGIVAFLTMQLTGNIWLAGVVVVVLLAAFGWFQDSVLWRPLRKRQLSLMQMMIVSIGLSILLQNLFQFFFGASILRIDPSSPETVTILGVTLTIQSYIAMGIALVAIVAVALAMKYTRFGRATRAVADNRALAEASGIDVNNVIRMVWTVGSSLAGLSGLLLGLVLNGIAWNTGWHYLLLLFAAVILGGIGTTVGAIVGAMIIGFVVEMANIWLPGDLKHAAALFILIVVLLVRPQGLFGRKERIG